MADSRSSSDAVSVPGALLITGVVDTFIVVGILAFGLASHGIDPISAPAYTARTALPFVLGWLVAAPLVGSYGRRSRREPAWAVLTTSLGWAGAVLIGSAIRHTAAVPGGAPLVFVLVTFVVGVGPLLAWRLGVVWWVSRRPA